MSRQREVLLPFEVHISGQVKSDHTSELMSRITTLVETLGQVSVAETFEPSVVVGYSFPKSRPQAKGPRGPVGPQAPKVGELIVIEGLAITKLDLPNDKLLESYKELGDLIKKARNLAGLTLVAVGELSGVHRNGISRTENASHPVIGDRVRGPSPRSIIKIAHGLNMDPGELLRLAGFEIREETVEI